MATTDAADRFRENAMSEVSEHNSHLFADNYRIERPDGIGGWFFVGVEHNEEEANAIAAYLGNRSGERYRVVKNRPDQVTAAKAMRSGREMPHVKFREDILTEMGVWAKPKRRRGK